MALTEKHSDKEWGEHFLAIHFPNVSFSDFEIRKVGYFTKAAYCASLDIQVAKDRQGLRRKRCANCRSRIGPAGGCTNAKCDGTIVYGTTP